MPWARCPAMEHQPSTGPVTTPTSTVALRPAATRPDSAPLARTRSCTWSEVLSRVMTRRSPGATSTASGTKRMPETVTVTSTVLPVAPTASAPESEEAPRPFRATPVTTATPAVARPSSTPRLSAGNPARVASRASRAPGEAALPAETEPGPPEPAPAEEPPEPDAAPALAASVERAALAPRPMAGARPAVIAARVAGSGSGREPPGAPPGPASGTASAAASGSGASLIGAVLRIASIRRGFSWRGRGV